MQKTEVDKLMHMKQYYTIYTTVYMYEALEILQERTFLIIISYVPTYMTLSPEYA